ncbi:hypothetical protein Ancab_019629 [Ancistrocladus abbreviatus]
MTIHRLNSGEENKGFSKKNCWNKENGRDTCLFLLFSIKAIICCMKAVRSATIGIISEVTLYVQRLTNNERYNNKVKKNLNMYFSMRRSYLVDKISMFYAGFCFWLDLRTKKRCG